jgi:hypothetical protein
MFSVDCCLPWKDGRQQRRGKEICVCKLRNFVLITHILILSGDGK